MTKKIFTLWIARALCERGFRVIRTEPNNEKPWMNVFVFNDDSKFQEALTDILSKGRQDR